MSRRRTIDWAAVDAAAHLDRIARSTLRELDVPDSTISTRCGPNGPWTRRGRGVIGLTTGPSTPHQLVREALCLAGDGAVVTGVAACRLLGLGEIPETDEVHVLVEHERRRQSEGHVVVERTTRLPPRPREIARFPVAPVERAVLDAVRRWTEVRAVRALVCEAVQRGLTNPRRLRRELEQGSQRGTALVRRVVTEVESGVRSVPEAEAREFVISDHRFTGMLWNHGLHRPDGRFLARPDGFLDDVALAWEINSRRHHADAVEFERTQFRQAEMTAAGIIVVTTTPEGSRRHRRETLDHLVGAYELACSRPRPAIEARPPER